MKNLKNYIFFGGIFLALAYALYAAAPSLPSPVALGVMTDTSGNLIAPTNFFEQNKALARASNLGNTNDQNVSGYVKTTATPVNNTYNNSIYSIQDWFADDGFRMASIGYNPLDGTSKYGHFNLFGTAINAYGNLMGIDFWNTNIAGGAIGSDRRAWVMRVKDPAGTNTANWTDKGAYTLLENRLSPSASDYNNSPFTLTFANYLLCDEFGNVGIGDCGQRSDDPAQQMLHPWAKTTFYPSMKAAQVYPLIGVFPRPPVATLVTNSIEWDGTNLFVTDKNLLRLKVAVMTTNGLVLTAPGTWNTNENVWMGTTQPTINLGSANTSANMYWNEATLLMTNNNSSGQVEWVIMINDKGMGGLRMDQQGTMNWHSTNFIFWNQTNSGGHVMTLKGGRINTGGAASVTATEQLAVSGNFLLTNGFARFWVGIPSPTASNFQAQVYCKTNAASGANELFAMSSSGAENILTGTVTNQFQGSGALDFPSTLANTNADLTITVTGAADADPVTLGVPNAAIIGGTCYTAWVSSANTVTVRFNNYTTGAKDPASATFKALVTKLK